MVTDDAFKAFAQQVEQEEDAKAERKANGGFTFDKLKWTGLPKRGCKVIRALGEAPNSFKSKFTARTYNTSKIKADDGKEIRVNLPLYKDDKDHLMWRIIDAVLAVEWDDGKKFNTNELRYPEIFNMVRYNKIPVGNPNRIMNKGWKGQEILIMNCIDRDPTVYQWSKENKHSVLLSKNVNISKDPQTGKVLEFVDPGIPAFGFIQALAHNLFAYYGDWKNYDMKIERTGTTTSPYIVSNASEHLVEVPENLRPYVVKGPLTDEELSWEMYDLEKYFKVTRYSKLFKRLQKSIASIDVCLGTHYLEELKSLAEEEKAEMERNKQVEEDVDGEETSTAVPGFDLETEKKVDAPAPATRASRTPASALSEPKGFAVLTEEEKKMVTSYKHIKDNTWDIFYEGIADGEVLACNVCKTPSPTSFAHCPGCGAMF